MEFVLDDYKVVMEFVLDDLTLMCLISRRLNVTKRDY